MGFEIAYSENVSPATRSDQEGLCGPGFSPVIGHSRRFFPPVSASTRIRQDLFIVASAAQGAGKNVAAVDYNNIHIGY